MTTNKPEVVAWSWDYRGRYMATTDYSRALELAEPPHPTEVEPLIRLADYQRLQADHERLQAECEKLRNLLVEIERGCSRRDMPSEQTISSWADAIDAAMQKEHNP